MRQFFREASLKQFIQKDAEACHCRNCASCQQRLSVILYKGVELDYCLGCGGIWFDVGELTKLRQYLNTSAMENRQMKRKGRWGDAVGDSLISLDFLEVLLVFFDW